MKNVTKLIIRIYNVKKIDWMGYKVSKDNPYTYHHLKKKCDGGKENIKNGAILTNYAHEYLNHHPRLPSEKSLFLTQK